MVGTVTAPSAGAPVHGVRTTLRSSTKVDIHEPIDFETQVKRAKKAKALADEICQSAEETQQKRLKIEHEHKLKLQEIEKLKKQQLKISL